ncbi:trypsin-like peptidase domain-containing protein [uncultured Propionibacterium sp.]|uniref:S1C family serine protease n=1 Tax=uncultured Propionibacterium sp. TaxID=218066 RepID=UPI002931CD49|nr:trypsin-like peptidase domain-containing protein [uncultured Propionibacterium sp.]
MSENNGHDIPWSGARHGGAGEPGQPADHQDAGAGTGAPGSRGTDETVAFGPDEQQTVAFSPSDERTIAFDAGDGSPAERTLSDVTGQGAAAPNQWPRPDQSSMWTGQAQNTTPGAQQNPWGPPAGPYAQQGPYQGGWTAGANGYAAGQQDPHQGPNGYQQPGQGQSPYGRGGPGQPWPGPDAQNFTGRSDWDANGQFSAYQQPDPRVQGFYDQFGRWVPYQQPQRPRSRSKSAAGIAAAVVIGLGALSLGVLEARNSLNPTPNNPSSRPSITFPAPSGNTSSAPTGDQTNATDAQSKGVVLIESQLTDATSAGTGMVLSSDGYVLTNYHVVQSSTAIYVQVAAAGQTYEATMVGHDATNDVALLRLNGASGLDTVAVDSDAVSVGDRVTAVGNSNGQGYLSAADGSITDTSTTVTVESELAENGEETLTNVYETSSQAVPGDSGGPLYDAEGEVTGMTTAGEQDNGYGASATTLRSWAIPIAHAMEIVDQIEAGNESGTVAIGPKAYLGVNVQSNASGTLTISSVVGDGPAAQAGLETGDQIVSVNGTAVASQNDLSTLMSGLEPGDTATVVVTTASGTTRSVRVTLGESPVN